MEDDQAQRPESQLPYDEWMEGALRAVVATAIEHVAANGLPAPHHFYITFRTDHPDVAIPPRLREQYPQEMTIVLQHQFWDLMLDREAGLFTVGLSFGGVPAMLRIPLNAVTAFADPHIGYGLRFRPVMPEPPPPPAVVLQPEAGPAETSGDGPGDDSPQVVSLDAFRRRSPPKS